MAGSEARKVLCSYLCLVLVDVHWFTEWRQFECLNAEANSGRIYEEPSMV